MTNVAGALYGAATVVMVMSAIMIVVGTALMNGNEERDNRIIRRFLIVTVVLAIAGAWAGTRL